MAAGGSRTVVYAAMAGNLAIAITKFVASGLTGSAAMLSEGIHSLVDTGNGALLLWGMRQSAKPADDNHPFGRGKELYFWTLIVAILIFALGGGISIYEGIIHLQHPQPIKNPAINYVVLSLAMVFEGGAWWVAFREFNKTRGDAGYWQAVRASKDPTTFTVLFEDSAAMLGLLVALAGLALGQALDIPTLDGAASVLIGAILCAVAVFLAAESKGLLIGEGVSPRTRQSIDAIVAADPDITKLVRALSMHLGPADVLLALEVTFRPELPAAQTAAAIERLDRAIRARHPEVKHLFIEAQSFAGHANAPAP